MSAARQDEPEPDAIRAKILAFAKERAGKTFCPSEVARALSEEWRPMMPHVREAASLLVEEGRVRCTQHGRASEPTRARGPIRLSAP